LILVDTNVLVDIVSDDPRWAEGSQRHLMLAAAEDQLAINDIVYTGLSIRYATSGVKTGVLPDFSSVPTR
jgi:hypothetical protein